MCYPFGLMDGGDARRQGLRRRFMRRGALLQLKLR
jgi:hypothetical protein